jgi:hypothetical protein
MLQLKLRPMKKISITSLHTWVGCFAICMFLALTPVASAQIDEQVSLDFPLEAEALETAKQTVMAYETGDWQIIRNNVTANARFYNLGTYDSLDVDQTIKYWEKGRQTATPVLAEDGAWLAVNIAEGPREGHWILHWGNNTLSYPNGETISFPYHVAFKVAEDKLDEIHFYYDNNKIVRAMGYEILSPIKDNEPEEGDDGF